MVNGTNIVRGRPPISCKFHCWVGHISLKPLPDAPQIAAGTSKRQREEVCLKAPWNLKRLADERLCEHFQPCRKSKQALMVLFCRRRDLRLNLGILSTQNWHAWSFTGIRCSWRKSPRRGEGFGRELMTPPASEKRNLQTLKIYIIFRPLLLDSHRIWSP